MKIYVCREINDKISRQKYSSMENKTFDIKFDILKDKFGFINVNIEIKAFFFITKFHVATFLQSAIIENQMFCYRKI